MKKLHLMLTVFTVLNGSVITAAGVDAEHVTMSAESRAVATAADLDKVKTHILGYTDKLGLSSVAETVGHVGCCPWFSTTFDAAQRFLLEELAGQLLTRFLAIALDDLADGRLDGIAHGKKISYTHEVGVLLGLSISDEELTSEPLDESLLTRLVGFGHDIASMIQEHGTTKEALIQAAGAFAAKKMDKARKNLAVALIQEADRIIELELGNGAIDGLDEHGVAIDWK